jgi:hypothetical protein
LREEVSEVLSQRLQQAGVDVARREEDYPVINISYLSLIAHKVH